MILPPDGAYFKALSTRLEKDLMNGLGISSYPSLGLAFDN
jgi:hypothetical protein